MKRLTIMFARDLRTGKSSDGRRRGGQAHDNGWQRKGKAPRPEDDRRATVWAHKESLNG